MQLIIDRIAGNPFMIGLLAICFTISMLLFVRRVRREQRHLDKPPAPGI